MTFTSPFLVNEFPKKASGVASYYGFEGAHTLFKKNPKKKRAQVALSTQAKRDPFIVDMHALFTGLSERELVKRDQPLFLYNINRDGCSNTFCEHPKKTARLSIVALGLNKSIAEAVVLQAAKAILREHGAETYRVYVNSMGDRDSTAKFIREASGYLRKHLHDMPQSLQNAIRRDIFNALEQIVQKEHPLREGLPRSMQFLTDASRRHLKEVLEYLEGIEMPYAIDDMLLGHKDCFSQTLFEIRVAKDDEEQEEMTVARGGRFDEISRRFFRFGAPGAGIVIEGGMPRQSTPPKITRKKPRICLINIGFGAKRKSLPLIETLRKIRVPLHQSLGSEQLGEQLEKAESLGIPYALIMGQREALDGTVIVRDMTTQSQITIPVDTLPTRIKAMKL